MTLKPENSRDGQKLYLLFKSLVPSWMKLPEIKMMNEVSKIPDVKKDDDEKYSDDRK